MDLARADALLFYEDHEPELESPNPLEGSEDDDTQQELEEMLYSRVYHESTSTDIPSSLLENCPILDVNITHINEEIPVTKSGCLSIEPSAFKSPNSCFRSEFKNPSRATASRYYDVNQDVHNARPIFIAPTNPGQKVNSKKVIKRKQSSAPSEFTKKLLARSSHEQSYMPMPKATTAVKETEEIDLTYSPARSSILPPRNVSKVSNLPPAITEQKKSESTEAIATQSLATSVPSLVSVATEPEERETPHLEPSEERTSKTPDDVQPDKVPTRVSKSKAKLQTFEAKVSRVLSSMLDEESRSSLEENHMTTQCTAQDLNDSGWSVGMSWADMSSKYSFGVDSIEEESVSSLQLHDTSFTADSRANSPDLQAPNINDNSGGDEGKNEEVPEEPSRYELQLKENKQGNTENMCDTDSESEVGSIVEVAPPVKPTPDLVDISDGEYTPAVSSSKIEEHVIDSSSDDDIVVLDVIDTTQTKRISRSPLKGQKRQSNTEDDGNSCSEHAVPPKRLSQHQDITNAGELFATRSLRETPLLGTSTPIKKAEPKMNRLDKWLFNPIKSSKYLDHDRYLAKMSDDPSLWKLCRADIMKMQSPRGPKCLNCNDFGHKTHSCRKPRKVISCHMCGQPGHTETRCKEKMCLRCGTKNTIFSDRCRKCTSNIVCEICSAFTHSWKTCPDLWRRYHLTTSSGNITQPSGVDIRPRSEQWCSNCARRGHLSHECNAPHWKCETISPFVKSYANVDAEENQLEGPKSFTLMLTNDAASVLDTEEGKDFLICLSVECQVAIHTSFDIAFKKLCMEGLTLAIEEVRSKIMQWTSPKEVHARRARLSKDAPSKNASADIGSNASLPIETPSQISKETSAKNASEESAMLPEGTPSNQNADLHAEGTAIPCTSSGRLVKAVKMQTDKGEASQKASTCIDVGNVNGSIDADLCNIWNLPPSPPKSYEGLATFLEEELKFIDMPVYCNLTVREVFRKYLQQKKKRKSTKDMAHYARILGIILLGKCGFKEGPNHLAALRNLVKKLRAKKGNIKFLYKQAAKHFNPIFRGYDSSPKDFQVLVNLFYSDETLVSMFDRKREDSPCVSDTTYPINSNDKAKQTSNLEENISRPIKNSKTNLTPVKRSLEKYTKVSLQPSPKLDASGKRLKHIVLFVLRNLSSRFIFSFDRTSLEKMYGSFCKEGGPEKKEIVPKLYQLIEKLCKSYDIKLPFKLLT